MSGLPPFHDLTPHEFRLRLSQVYNYRAKLWHERKNAKTNVQRVALTSKMVAVNEVIEILKTPVGEAAVAASRPSRRSPPRPGRTRRSPGR